MGFFSDIGIQDPFEATKSALSGDFPDPLGLVTESKGSKRARRQRRELDRRMAAVTREQYQHFLDFYRPLEEKVLAEAMRTDFTAEGDRAGDTARAGVLASQGTLSRNLRRAGLSLSGEEAEAVRRRRALNLTRSDARAENTTRRGLADSRTHLLAEITGIGRGVAQTAVGGLQSATDMGSARYNNFLIQDQQAQGQRQQAAATGLALLLAAV